MFICSPPGRRFIASSRRKTVESTSQSTWRTGRGARGPGEGRFGERVDAQVDVRAGGDGVGVGFHLPTVGAPDPPEKWDGGRDRFVVLLKRVISPGARFPAGRRLIDR